MTDDLEVRVLPGPGRRDRREAQGPDREGGFEGSVERSREPTNRNRMRGAADQGELARDSEALAAKEEWRKSGSCGVKVGSLTQGDLASRLKGRRTGRRSEKSAEGVVCAGQRTDQEGSSPSGARMRGAISESGGNSSLAREFEYGEH